MVGLNRSIAIGREPIRSEAGCFGVSGALGSKVSSIGNPKKCAILKANRRFGLCLWVSMGVTVCLETPSRSASTAWGPLAIGT